MSNIYQNIQLDRIATAIENGDAGGGTLTINLTGVGDMQPATASTAGAHGLVPAPQAGDERKYLTGGGTFETAGGSFPDYSNPITSGSYNMFDGFRYTATQDCFAFIMVGCSSSLSYPTISLNNTSIGYLWGAANAGVELPVMIPLKAGDTLDVSATNQGNNWSEKYVIFAI